MKQTDSVQQQIDRRYIECLKCPMFVFREDSQGEATKDPAPGLQDQGGEELRLKGWKFAF